ncbi:MAG TPA: PhzF family phenazine biosynthesis protein [Thermoanaerobaculia bacterium]
MQSTIDLVDAFGDGPFTGNQAAVCVLPEPRPEAWMAAFAAEMNLSETAFLQRLEPDRFGLRWFTPTIEVPLCGHATLASAHVLTERGLASPGRPIAFETKSGRLTARPAPDAGGAFELDFPEEVAIEEPAPREILEALGLSLPPRFSGRNRMDWLLEVSSEDEVRSVAPDFLRLMEATRPDRGVIVTARSSSPQADFVSRFFAPVAGIDEDPATGSTHCALGPHWARRLGRAQLSARQLSRRGGAMTVRVEGNGRVVLRGRAITIARGELAI